MSYPHRPVQPTFLTGRAMYIPPHFAEQRPTVLHQFIRDHPFASLITTTADGLAASHLPLVLHEEDGRALLRGHFSRANAQSRLATPTVDALAIFHGPEAYISPSWYPTKQETGKVVPTWNFIVVHVQGSLRLVNDRDFLLQHLHSLTNMHETPRSVPWSVDDAPADYVDAAMKGIVAFEITIERLEGKWKLSQNRPEADRAGVVAGLRHEGDALMAELVRNPAAEVRAHD